MKCIPIILLLIGCLHTAQAQKSKCRVKNPANKNKALRYQDIETRYQHWPEGGMQVTQIGDSLTVKDGDIYIAGFRFDKGRIPRPKYREYHENGMIKTIDSLTDGREWHLKRYWGCSEGRIVYTRNYYANGMPEKFIYFFRKNGKDSLIQRWYPNGVLKETAWKYPWGSDSLKYSWNNEGMPTAIDGPGLQKEFYPTGNIKSITTDTIIGETHRMYIKTYYPAGTPKAVRYYDNERSSNTWLYYTEEGLLDYTIDGSSMHEILPTTIPPALEEDLCGYPIMCEIEPEFPEGVPRYVYEKLPAIICQSKKRLTGTYEIQLMIDTDGRAVFENLSGKNHTAILEPIKAFIEKMPRWKPGKKNGRPMKVGLSLKLSLENVK